MVEEGGVVAEGGVAVAVAGTREKRNRVLLTKTR